MIKRILLGLGAVGMVLASTATTAKADTILTFGQAVSGRPVVATQHNTAGSVSTTIAATDVQISVTQFASPSLTTPATAYLDLNAHSIGNVSGSGTALSQDYSGTFSIYSGTGMTGTNILSGTFTDYIATNGSSLSLIVDEGVGGETVHFTSAYFNNLASPRSLSITLLAASTVTKVNGSGAGSGTSTLSGFTASTSGNFAAAPEPATVAAVLSGLPVLAFSFLRFRRKAA